MLYISGTSQNQLLLVLLREWEQDIVTALRALSVLSRDAACADLQGLAQSSHFFVNILFM